MTDMKIDERVQLIEWPVPSDALRERVLKTRVDAATITWSDRVWFSRSWRISVAAAAVAIVVIGQWAARGPAIASVSADTAVTQEIEGAVIDAGIPADVAVTMAKRFVIARHAAPASIEQLLKTFGDQ